MAKQKDKATKESDGKAHENVSVDDEEINEYCKNMPLTEDTSCGFWFMKGQLLQAMANKKVLVLLFGLTTSIYGATFSYFNSTISTMERVFRIPSRTIGIICSGNDIVKFFGSVILNYYATKGHKPRWIAMGLFCSAIACFLNAMPHAIYQSSDDVLQWTEEYGGDYMTNTTSKHSINKQLCGTKDNDKCDAEDTQIFAVVYLFVSQLLSGIGGIAVYSMGFSYLDDNIQKKKSPALISTMFFMRLMGPTIGYTLGTLCLKIFIRPDLHSTLEKNDPRWLGAWWLGWIVLGITLLLVSAIMGLFPKSLPRAAARRELIRQKSNTSEKEETVTSFRDLLASIKRLMKNPIYVLHQTSTTLFVLGYLPFWTYLQKYTETMYRMPAAVASMYSGSFGLGFAAIGTIIGGFLVQKYKPSARTMALCNALTSVLVVLGVLGYMLTGCPDVDNMMANTTDRDLGLNTDCNTDCDCELVRYSHVCSADKTQAFVSPCHAGCSIMQKLENDQIIFSNCSCITSIDVDGSVEFGSATPGPCPVHCQKQTYLFVATLCFVKMITAMSKITNFLISIRCVEERDKSVSLGLNLGVISLLALIPAPIFYGFIIDSACSVWSKTCSGTGNCWLLNSWLMRYRVVSTCLGFLSICIILDFITWKIIGDLPMFSDVKPMEYEPVKKEEDDHVNNTEPPEKIQ